MPQLGSNLFSSCLSLPGCGDCNDNFLNENNFTELSFKHYVTHSFKVYNPVEPVLTELCNQYHNHLENIFPFPICLPAHLVPAKCSPNFCSRYLCTGRLYWSRSTAGPMDSAAFTLLCSCRLYWLCQGCCPALAPPPALHTLWGSNQGERGGLPRKWAQKACFSQC